MGDQTRRQVLKAAGIGATGSLLAGCTGGDGGDGGDGGASTPTPEERTVVRERTVVKTPEPSLEATFGEVSLDFQKIPYVTAVRSMLPGATDGRFSGKVQRFRGGTLQQQALIAGQIEFTGSSPGPVFQSSVAGNDVKIIATKLQGTDYVIALREDISGLEAFANSDLQFGTSTTGGLSYTQAVGVFQQNGVNPDDVNIINIGGSTTRTNTIASGNIDGTVIHISQYQRIKDQGVKSVGRVSEYYPNLLQQTFACRGEWLQEDVNQQYVQAFCNQLVQAHERAMNDFDWMYENAQKYQAQSMDRESAQETWDFMVNTLGSWPTGEFNVGAYENYRDLLGAAGLIEPSAVDLDSILEPTYWNNALENMDS